MGANGSQGLAGRVAGSSGCLGVVSSSSGDFVLDQALAMARPDRPVELLVSARQAGLAAKDLAGRVPGGGRAPLQVVGFRHWPEALRPRLLGAEGNVDLLEARPWLMAEAACAAAAMAGALAREMERWNAACAHWLLPAGFLVGAGSRLPALLFAHSADVHLLKRLPGRNLLVAALGRPGVRVVFSSRFVARTLLDSLQPQVARILEERAVVQPMGVSVPDRLPGRAEARRALGIPAEGFVALFLGRLVPVKNPGLVIEAARRLPEVIFLVAGDGPLAGALAHASPNVRALGFVRGERKWAALAACDVLVHPSTVLPGGRTEGAPVAILEALAWGRPVVATAVGGVAELLDPGRTGWLVPDGDLDALVRALREATRGAGHMAEAAAQVGRRHGWDQVALRLEALLGEAQQEVGLSG